MTAPVNYTTTISADKTVGEMQTALGKAGASRIGVEYAAGAPTALAFTIDTPHGPRSFTLPVNVDAMHQYLVREDRRGNLRGGASKAVRSSREQAERVAWRVTKDWLLAQLALVESSMAELDQVMLPYLHIDQTGRTLYASYKERETAALEAPASQGRPR